MNNYYKYIKIIFQNIITYHDKEKSLFGTVYTTCA